MQSARLPFNPYRSGEDFLSAAGLLTGGCVLTDVKLPGMSGPDLQTALANQGFRLPIIFLTGHGNVSTSVRVLQAGAFDFLQKPIEDALLLSRIRAALESDAKRQQAEDDKKLLQAKLARLTEREREVMDLVVRGYTNKEVGRELGISHRTVEVYRGRVMQKLQVETLLGLVLLAGTGTSPASPPTPRVAHAPAPRPSPAAFVTA
jgi:RNA polymerase sigma factor (sigma-70 family)